jgi:amino acid adenylation domain-containing protein
MSPDSRIDNDGLPEPPETGPVLFPASFGQQRLWLAERLAKGASPYIVAAAVRIEGALDIPTLRGAFEDCVARHESLRTFFIEIEGAPWQAIAPEAVLPFETIDLTALAEGEAEQEAMRLSGALATRPMPLGAAPLVRVLLARVTRQRAILALAVHHIVFDGSSLAVLLADLAAFYRHRRDRTAPLPPDAPIQYADFSEWQREQLETTEGGLRAYWKERLDGLAPLALPRTATPGVPAAPAGTIAFRIGPDLAGRLRSLARRHGATCFMVFLAAFKLTLARSSGQTDIAVATPVAQRGRPELHGVIGYVSNTLVLRTDLARAGDLADLLSQVREETLGALAHAEMPFDLLAQRLAVPRTGSRHPWMRALFALQPEGPAELGPQDLRITPLRLPPGAPKADVALEITEQDDRFEAVLEYDPALFANATAQAVADGLQNVLNAFCTAPETALELAAPPALPVRTETPQGADPATGTPPSAATGLCTRALADAWRELLGKQPATEDDFFAAGGHSLLAARLVARLRDRLGVEVPLAIVFDTPRFADMAAAIATQATPAGEAPIQPISRFSALPLSHAQMRLWFMQQLEPESTAYTLSGAVRITGPLDTDRLRKALQMLQLRHESLRTKFRDFEGRPLQVIVPSAPVALPVEDIAHLSGADRAVELRRIAMSEAARPFDLTEAPLLRTRLVRLGDDEHALLIGLHHIVGDGKSIRLLWRDVALAYRAPGEGLPPALPALGLQYADYAQWQKSRLTVPETERLLGYWRGVLDGVLSLDIPTDFPRPALQSAKGAEVHFRIPSTLAARLAAFGQSRSATMFMVLLSAFQGLMAQWSGQSDIAVGVPVSTRDRDELQDIIGCFVNTLVLRGDLSGAPSFTDLVDRTRTRFLEVFEHRHMPFEQLVEALSPERDLSRHPLFQVLFDYQEAADPAPISEALAVSALDLGGQVSQFDVALYLEQIGAAAGGDIAATLVYRTDLFSPATMERMASGFVDLLAAAVDAPDKSLVGRAMLSREGQRQLQDWNDTTVDLGPPASLDDLIAAQAARTPDAVAVRAEDGSLTFRDLLARADALAVRLNRAGAGPDKIVAVCLERGLAMPVALLACLRAGAAYLPIDPELPAERIAFMMADAAPVAVVTTAEIAAPGVTVIDAATITDLPAATLPPLQRDDADLAYVIYTSGSTGQPKGVMVSHRAIVNRLRWMQHAYPIDGTDRVLQKTPFAFDVSVWEFFWPMITGATLVMARPGGHRDPGYLAAVIDQQRITVLHFVPSMLEAFLPLVQHGHCRSLLRVFTSGEALPPELRDRYLDSGLRAGLYNLYGPTEAAVDVTFWDCVPRDRGQPVPIGRPIANLRIHVLDSAGNETPIGVPGEICIGGIGLARGYLNRPELTDKQFVPDPFSGDPKGRLYRTGDRGRWRDDGAIEYLGRLDFQVKLRGQRIELGEIEAVLRSHPAVREAAVVLHGTGAGQRLTAFVTLLGTAEPAAIAAFARDSLPGYMVPSAVIVQPSLPLSLNGKLDRNRLATLAETTSAPRNRTRLAPPRTEVERRIATVWHRVLERSEIGIEDNFFDVGGNSLLLAQVHSRLREAFEKPLTLVDMFRLPTIARLAAFLSDRRAADEAAIPAGAIEAGDAIAVIGLAGRFPGAPSVEALWDNLLAGREGIRRLDAEMLRAAGVPAALIANPNYVPATGALDDIDLFDAEFFGYSPAEAARLDPQGRLLLECAWTALEDAAIAPSSPGLRIGVFAGGTASGYSLGALAGAPLDGSGGAAAHQMLLGNDKDYLATRISYKLGLKGPSLSVQTACSTSLVAICLAARALRDGDCDVALAGGVSISVPHLVGYLQEEGSITSPDGHCRAFDAAAAGTVPGSGVGLVVLKRLGDALRDGDPVRAVIRGAAVTNDGADKVGFTAPSVGGQARAIRAALAEARILPAAIGFVEAHGTGTPLGDQVEITALSEVFTGGGDPPLLGSLKTNIGHLDAASGVAGFIKAARAVETGIVPPILHLKRPNPLLAGPDAALRLNTEAVTWPVRNGGRLAGVSSAGMGGTNAHVILEQPPAPAPAVKDNRPQLLVLSARTRAALAARVADLIEVLQRDPPPDLVSLAWTLQSGRETLPWRISLVAGTPAEAARRLAVAPLPAAPAPQGAANCHFLFPGQGAQRVAMGRALYEREAAFRAEVDRCLAALDRTTAAALRAACFGPAEEGVAELHLKRTAIVQPALFILELALARLLIGWGIQPTAMIGHSLGEFAAATLAGVFGTADAVRLIALRGRLMQKLPPGAMVQVAAPEADLLSLLPADISVAAVNGARATLLSGPTVAIDALCTTLDAEGLPYRRLRVSHAFHSAMMEPAIAPLAEDLSRLKLSPPEWPFVSTVTGDWITDAEATDPAYWAAHLRRKVRFADGLRTLAAQGPAVFLEIGPGRALSALVLQDGLSPGVPVLPLDDPESGDSDIRAALGRLWEAGLRPDWAALHGGAPPPRIHLPTYRFQGTRHWLMSPPSLTGAASVPDIGAALYVPGWRATPTMAVTSPTVDEVVLLTEETGPWAALAERLRARGLPCRLHPTDKASGALTGKMAHLVWPVPTDVDAATGVLPQLRDLARALQPAAGRVRLTLVTCGAEEVLGGEALSPHVAAAAIAGLVLAQEHPELLCRLRDLDRAEADNALASLVEDIAAPTPGRLGALRRGRLWLTDHRPTGALPASQPALSERGVVLVTGAAGRLGRALAQHFSKTYRARLVLISRRPLKDWADVARDCGAPPADVLCLSGDIAEASCAREAVAAALRAFGALDGVIHAAGLVGAASEEAIADLTPERSAATLRAKLGGVESLAAAMEGQAPEFVLVTSSLSTLLGGAGMAAYAAANRAMEVAADEAGKRLGQRWISLAFDGLDFGGATVSSGTGSAQPMLAPSQALALIDEVLASGFSGRIAAVAFGLDQRLRSWVTTPPDNRLAPMAAAGDAPATGSDSGSVAHVIALWRELLGHADIGPDDNFFTLGGDSLMAITLMSQLRARTGLPLTLGMAMEAPTPGALATLIAGLRAAQPEVGPGLGDAVEEGTL